MIDVLKDYYPYVLNYILVMDMPWVLNGKFLNTVGIGEVAQEETTVLHF